MASRTPCEAIVELCLERHSLIGGNGILEEIEDKLRTNLKITPTEAIGPLHIKSFLWVYLLAAVECECD